MYYFVEIHFKCSIILDKTKYIPDPSDFTVHWIETRPGRSNRKTGVPPSLYTLRITDFVQCPGIV